MTIAIIVSSVLAILILTTYSMYKYLQLKFTKKFMEEHAEIIIKLKESDQLKREIEIMKSDNELRDRERCQDIYDKSRLSLSINGLWLVVNKLKPRYCEVESCKFRKGMSEELANQVDREMNRIKQLNDGIINQ